ncbi:MAG: ATP-binding cassette domain-containing protein [Ignavibacteria bacterium]|nr:ATP-binding cassette domain-containing protein [Ignavibacteria bacterium]
MNIIRFENVSHRYDGKAALSRLSFGIEDNKITVIIGRSGSGKSTLLQIINGLIKPSEGKVEVFDAPLNYSSINKTRLKIGYSVQGTGLFPHMNVYDNIALLGKITKQLRHVTETRLDMLMSLVNLEPGFKTKYPYQLSGGEQQRVGICRAMIMNPPVFLLDEAFGALDNATRNEIHAELLNMQKIEPRAIVLVTHDLDEALKLADNIMVLEKGVIQQYGLKEEVLNNPSNEFVKNFLRQRIN